MYWSVSQNQRKSYEKHGISKYSKIRTGDLDMVISTWFLLYLLLLKFFFCFLFLLYFTLQSCMVLPYIDMNPHGCTCVPKHEPPSHLPSHNISLGHHCAPAPSMLYPALDIDWRFDSFMIVYMFQCHSPKSGKHFLISKWLPFFGLFLSVFLVYFIIINFVFIKNISYKHSVEYFLWASMIYQILFFFSS